MPSREPRVEVAGGQRLPLGGLNGYAGVRGKQGRKKDMFQGVTPKKKHRTRLFGTAQEAALALAQLREDLELGMLAERAPKKAVPPACQYSLTRISSRVMKTTSKPPAPPAACRSSARTSWWRRIRSTRAGLLAPTASC